MPVFALMRFNVRCVIFAKRGTRFARIFDKGRRIEEPETGDIYYRLKKQKKNTVPVPFDSIYEYKINEGKRRGNTIYFYSPANGLYFPIKLNEELEKAINAGNVTEVEKLIPAAITVVIPNLTDPEKVKLPVDEKLETWIDWLGFRIYKNRAMTDVRGALEKHLPLIMFMVTMIVVAVTIFILMKGIDSSVARITGLEQQYIQERTADRQILQQIINLVQQGKLPADIINPLVTNTNNLPPPPGV